MPDQKDTVKKDTTVSTENFLRFVRFTPTSFAGLHKEMKLAIVFDEPDKRIVGFTGDQGAGKTSALNALYSLLGGTPPKNALNAQDKAIDEELVFERNGEQYVSRMTKGSFTVTKFDKEGARSKMEAPKDFLKKVIGPIGLNPMDLKAMKGPEQIKWLRELTVFTAEQLTFEADLLAKKKIDYDKRTETKRSSRQMGGEISASGYYIFDCDNQVFKATEVYTADKQLITSSELDELKVATNLREAEQRKNDFLKWQTGLTTLEQQKQNLFEEIERLKLQMERAQNSLEETNKRIAEGEKLIKENEDSQQKYDEAFAAMRNLSAIKLKEKNLADIDAKVTLYTEKVEEEVLLDAKLDEHDKLQRQFVQSFTPAIEGLEVVIAGLDTKKEEGIYYKEKTPVMLSESELFELYIQLLACQNVRVAIIENITSLGTAAIERINWFAQELGGYVFYSAMERGKDKLGFQFLDRVK